MLIEVRWPTPEDCRYLVDHLRAADRDELEATIGGQDKHEAMRYCVSRSSHAWAVLIDDAVAMIGGLAPMSTLLGGEEAQPWMMATTVMERRPGMLTKVGLKYLRVMKGAYPRLSNFVDARNTASIRWLRRLGFTVHQHTIPFGPFGLPFHPFEMNC